MRKISTITVFVSVLIGLLFFFKTSSDNNRVIPNGAVNITFPLKNGIYKVTQSGESSTAHKSPIEEYAIDIIRNNDYTPFLSRYKFRDSSLETSTTFNTPVYSPCDGIIDEIKKNYEDMPIGIRGKSDQTNFININCHGFNVYMAHFKKGSISVRKDESVKTGQQIGLIGNSGYSDGPHLHIHAYKLSEDKEKQIPLPILFNGKYLYKGDIYP